MAYVVSLVFHPALMLTYCTAYLMFATFSPLSRYETTQQFMLLGVVFFNTFVVPAAVTWFTQANLELTEQRERTQPILFGALLHGITWYFLYTNRLPAFYSGLFLAATISLVLGVAINLRYRISFHAVGMGLVAGLFLGLSWSEPHNYHHELMGAFVLSGMVLSARWALGAHAPHQMLTGWLVGAGLAMFLVGGWAA